MSNDAFDLVTEEIGKGEEAGEYAPHVKVWSEFAVRAAVMRVMLRSSEYWNKYNKDSKSVNYKKILG